MKFYKVTMQTKEKMSRPTRFDDKEGVEISKRCRDSEIVKKSNAKMFLFSRTSTKLNFVICGETDNEITEYLKQYMSSSDYGIKNEAIEEISCDEFVDSIMESSRNDYCEYDDVMTDTELNKLYSSRGHSYVPFTDMFAAKTSDKFLFSKAYYDELNRINIGSVNKSIKGHPVHYVIAAENEENSSIMFNNLICSLENAGRLNTNRYVLLKTRYRLDREEEEALDTLYGINKGGTVCLSIEEDYISDEHREFSRGIEDYMECVNRTAEKYMNSVLTVICLPNNSDKAVKILRNYFPSFAFVTIDEEAMNHDGCLKYFRHLAKKDKLTADKNLLTSIEKNSNHYKTELNGIYAHWHQKKITTECYPQYAEFDVSVNTIEKEETKGNSYQELMSMIGLKEAKQIINEALDYFKARKLFKENGFIEDKPSMHMVFTGSPGTAKTSVARLFADILRDNSILETGNFVECGRSDLVGQFVGWTAKIVKQKFDQAKGGVLFIDEAYSLVDDKHGMFGDEAINTIVQEMENHREDTIVIFAGYTNEMEKFLDRNPGLRSRIAFHVPFADYNAEELYMISELMAKKNGITFSENVKEKLLPIMETASKQSDFGNGRFARNMIERARMKQAGRLVHSGAEFITKDMMSQFVADDFEMPVMTAEKQTVKNAIGF